MLPGPAGGVAHRLRGNPAKRHDAGCHRGPVGEHRGSGADQGGGLGGPRVRFERHACGRAARLVAARAGPVAAVLCPEELAQVDLCLAGRSRSSSASGATSVCGLYATVTAAVRRCVRSTPEAYAGGGPLRPRAVYTGPPAIIDP